MLLSVNRIEGNKHMNKKIIALSLIAAAALSLGTTTVVADDCTTDYGGTTTCKPTDLFINKQVQDPMTGQYVENVSTAKFNQGDTVVFKMIVTNSSNQLMNDTRVTDTVPENLVITDAQANYTNPKRDGQTLFEISSDKKSVTFFLGEMAVGQTKEMFLWTKVVGPYPAESQFCRDNWANVTSSERPNGDKNFARVCVANKAGEATTLPVAGAEDLLMMLPFIGTGLAGFALLTKRNK
jgi:uncharacterized repeat protein (TIGR01451 family)